jgi:CCR4-NOT transcriptional complex subunit CAF120
MSPLNLPVDLANPYQIDALPTRSGDDQPLQNVLSLSTAGKNRYLLHFNSHHSLIQWTAAIRLAIFEYTTLQEAYTGALIAGKGKSLNNINIIMERARFKYEDWVRVRFGAGTPWRRCWCVVSPPDEKEVQKLEKELKKKKSAYDRNKPPILKGNVKFYDTRKTKKVEPIASIVDAYSAFAIYPQSKPLIDASTLIKVEGTIRIHSNPPTLTEGFVFVMPETHAAVSGFEIMLRWLFPVFDVFHLYGRPGRLVADTLDPRSLMFAMPKERRYGYLEILDVSSLILTEGSQTWSEGEWRKRMKDLTAKRMIAIGNGSRAGSRAGSRRNTRSSLPPIRSRGDDGASIRSTPSISWGAPPQDVPYGRTDSAPPTASGLLPTQIPAAQHQRSASDSRGFDSLQKEAPIGIQDGHDQPPSPPPHSQGNPSARETSNLRYGSDSPHTPERPPSSEDEAASGNPRIPVQELQDLHMNTGVEPVVKPPAFAHAPNTVPPARLRNSPELRRTKSRMSNGTLSQMAGAGGIAAAAGVAAYNASLEQSRMQDEQNRQNHGRPFQERGVHNAENSQAGQMNANQTVPVEGFVTTRSDRPSFEPSRSTPQSEDHLFLPTSSNPPIYISNNPSTSSYPSNDNYTSGNYPPAGSVVPPGLTSTYQSQNASTSRMVQPSRASQEYQQGHSHSSSTDSNRSQPYSINTRHSIIRKPLPTESTGNASHDAPSPQTASSTGSNLIDESAFEKVVPQLQIQHPALRLDSHIHRQDSNSSSNYDEPEPDLSQKYPMDQTRTPRISYEDRPRSGVLKTVGGGETALPYVRPSNADIPNFDFGPTINLHPTRLARDPSPADRDARNVSRERFGTNTSSVPPPIPTHRKLQPEPRYEPGQINGNRSVPWQPGMSTQAANAPRKQLTPEQFVQQRAAAASGPHLLHKRQPSNISAGSNGHTPSSNQSQRPDYFAHSRNPSSELLQQRPGSGPNSRPNSRGPSAALGGSGDYSTNLSAKEQEHLSRVTGAPLVNLPAGTRAPTGGLVGAIDAREREKQNMKQGINSQAVQNAVIQRQQEAQYQKAQQYPGPQQGYGQAQQYPQYPPQGQVQYQQQQGGQVPGSAWVSPQQTQTTPEQIRQHQLWMQNQQYYQYQGGHGRDYQG